MTAVPQNVSNQATSIGPPPNATDRALPPAAPPDLGGPAGVVPKPETHMR